MVTLKWTLFITGIFYSNPEHEGVMRVHMGTRENGGMSRYRTHWVRAITKLSIKENQEEDPKESGKLRVKRGLSFSFICIFLLSLMRPICCF